MNKQGPFAVDDGVSAGTTAHAALERYDVPQRTRNECAETSGRSCRQRAPAGGRTHSAILPSTARESWANPRSMASTVNEAIRASASLYTRHSEWVIPSPAKVERW